MRNQAFIDITHPLYVGMPLYPNNPEFSVQKVLDLEKGDGATVSALHMGTHTGTHIDAPSHFLRDGKTLDMLPMESYNGEAVLLDLRGRAVIGAADLCERLAESGFSRGDILLLKTDNSERFTREGVLKEYVTLDYEAAQAVVDAGAKLVGIDYMTIERPRSMRQPGHSVHAILLGADVLICETLDLRAVEHGKYQFFCFPLKLDGADGAPARIALQRL